MFEILGAADSSSVSFASSYGPLWIFIDEHQGGVWSLQALSPSGQWRDLDDTTFSGPGCWTIALPPPAVQLRISGGTVGATAYVLGFAVSLAE